MANPDEVYDQDLTRLITTFNGILGDPASTPSSIISAILTEVTLALPQALASSVWATVSRHPTHVDSILSKLNTVVDDERLQSLEVVGGDDGPEEFLSEFYTLLNETISDNLHIVPGDAEERILTLNESNPVLTAALLQAVGLKVGLIDSEHHVWMIKETLGLDDTVQDPKEVLVVAALLVFEVMGAERVTSEVAEAGEETYDDVTKALAALKDRDVVRDANALALLEIVIGNAERKVNKCKRGEEAWSSLFT
ncbi:hypothetical protein DFP72DRAFT_1135165 [Ephemerocybe angulata]|uniref:Uncharacterized protein n=1 Tax=Ephemerocybe angulata TaxID=980116 RepID=A0A8H6HT32_9AGAR|nr:hypothetical protein DFP72DRAFT_1135165 [Tulosesus angulatus]